MSAFEDKILSSGAEHFRSLSKRLGGNFSNFVDQVLEEGGRGRSGAAGVNVHWRPFHAT